MAKGKKGRSNRVVEQDFGLDEVDSFHAAQEKILLEEGGSTKIGNRRQRDDDEDSDVGVLDVEDASDSDDAEEFAQEDDEDDDAEFFGKKDEDLEEEEEEGAWGSKKGAYYGADRLDDEEAAKEIEEEALRQQKKHLQELNMDDYIDEDLEEEWSKKAKSHDYGDILEKEEEDSKAVSDITKLDPKSRKKYITSAHPEYVPLTKELTKLTPVLEELSTVKDKNEVSNVKFIALSAYLGAITMYLAVFLAFTEEQEPFTMKEHPVMESILSSKETWRQASLLEDVSDDEEDENMEIDEDGDAFQSAEESLNALSEGESSDDDEEEEENAKESSESDSDLDIDISKPRVFKKTKQTNYDDLVEGGIADVDAEDKKARKKTLRFYTSKIDQQDKKKDEKYTGDLDLPYKERLFERQQRLIEEARKRGLEDENGADLDDNESFDEQDANDAKFVNDEFDDSYYQTVKSSKLKDQAERKEAHLEAVRAAKEGRLAELNEEAGENGKRAINYQILKNKGLTAHKKKDDRNSRVKKRKKYEKAQKKLKSVRAVYSAPSGAYDGEKTGIKKNLSKSVKFNG